MVLESVAPGGAQHGKAGGSGGGGGSLGSSPGNAGAGNTPSTSPAQGFGGRCEWHRCWTLLAFWRRLVVALGGVGESRNRLRLADMAEMELVQLIITGSAVTYGGGGGGAEQPLAALVGSGGGGAGTSVVMVTLPMAGTDGTGGGGGGSATIVSGDSGDWWGWNIVIIRRPTLGAEGGRYDPPI